MFQTCASYSKFFNFPIYLIFRKFWTVCTGMIGLLVTSVTLSSAWAVTPKSNSVQSPGSSCIQVRPGISIGPVRLGMDEKQLQDLKLGLKYTSGRYKAVAEVGPYRVVFREQKGKSVVSIVQYDLSQKATCFQVGRTKVQVSRKPEGIASQLGSCKPMEMRIGGNNIKCFDDGLWILFKSYRGAEWRSLHVQAIVPVSTAEIECFAYTVPSSYLSTPDREVYVKPGKPVSVTVQSQKNYCIRHKHLHTQTKENEIPPIFPGECSQHTLKTETAVYCNHTGMLFVFRANKLMGWKMFHVEPQKPLPSFDIMHKKFPNLTKL